MAPAMQVARVPEIIDRIPRETISPRLSGTILPTPKRTP